MDWDQKDYTYRFDESLLKVMDFNIQFRFLNCWNLTFLIFVEKKGDLVSCFSNNTFIVFVLKVIISIKLTMKSACD